MRMVRKSGLVVAGIACLVLGAGCLEHEAEQPPVPETREIVVLSPTIFASVPRIWEKFVSAVHIRMSDSTIVKRVFYRLALGVGLKYVRAKDQGKPSMGLSLAYWIMYALVLFHLRRQMGLERIRYAICGAAPASPELFQWYNAIGVKLREGYGQTESTGSSP